jgi:hypothetical protein
MQEIKKRRIVIASVLKPVDDPRMTEKIGKSLASHYEVSIAGFPSRKNPAHPEIVFYPSPLFSRLSFRRIAAPWRILSLVMKVRPSLLIISTHELLCIGVIAKLFVHCRVIYDVQENYYRNILHTNAFPRWVRPWLALYVRMKEWITSPFIDHYLLAEKGYEQELTFPGKKYTVIENKFKRLTLPEFPKRHVSDGAIHLLFSGTLAASTGVFKAIELATALHRHDSRVRLTIIGYCAQEKERERIQRDISDKPWIELYGGDHLIPYEEIVKAILTSDFGIIAYPPNPSTENAIPTKLYEYLANKLPILLTVHPVWTALCRPYPASIVFKDPILEAEAILRYMETGNFYINTPQEAFWDTEEKKLVALIERIIPL